MTTEATTTEEIIELLHAEGLQRSFGLELLDENDILIEDISDELRGGWVDRNNYGTVHGSCELQLSRPFTWETARMRPRITLVGAGLTKTWNEGVYLAPSPDTELGETPATHKVRGQDKLALLNRPVGESYSLAAGSGYLAGVRAIITASGVTGLAPLLDGTAESTTLTTAMVWLLDPSAPPTFLGMANDVLAMLGYRGLYANRDGRFCSEPYQSPGVRTPTWTFDLTDQQKQMVREDRQMRRDELDRTNYFVFVRTGMATKPISGAGLYIVDNSGTGTKYKRTWWLPVESQTELVSKGNETVEEMTQRKWTINFPCSPAPVLWHFDVVNYWDMQAGGYLKGQIMNWRQPLDLSDMAVQMEVIG
jgi:hypothetical protein